MKNKKISKDKSLSIKKLEEKIEILNKEMEVLRLEKEVFLLRQEIDKLKREQSKKIVIPDTTWDPNSTLTWGTYIKDNEEPYAEIILER